MSVDGDDVHLLSDLWTAYFHHPSDTDWTATSYVRLADVSSVEDYAVLERCLTTDNKTTNGMFFLMREHVFPCWDDASNIRGGCVCIKIPKTIASAFWNDMCSRLLSDTLVASPWGSADVVNGISISPKTFYVIVKVWVRDHSLTKATCFNLPRGYVGEVLYKPNLETIIHSHSATVGLCVNSQDNKYTTDARP